ncbi:MAG: archease [Nanoarchaeota archaeon]|nr:archease [Nanoarchaeota archaeon]
MKKYEFLEHTADIKFRARGKDLNEAFENCVLAICDFISKGQKIKHARGEVVNVSGRDKKELLYNFLEEILVLLDSKGFLTASANVQVLGNTIKAEFFGDDVENYSGLDPIKAPTFAEMYVREVSGSDVFDGGSGWEIQAVMDV